MSNALKDVEVAKVTLGYRQLTRPQQSRVANHTVRRT